MSKRLQHHAPYLQALVKGAPKQRRAIIGAANKELLGCLCECTLNVLNGNIPLKSSDKKKLQKYKRQIRSLVNKKVSVKKKKKTLSQKGGFLGALLTPVLSALGGLLFK